MRQGLPLSGPPHSLEIRSIKPLEIRTCEATTICSTLSSFLVRTVYLYCVNAYDGADAGISGWAARASRGSRTAAALSREADFYILNSPQTRLGASLSDPGSMSSEILPLRLKQMHHSRAMRAPREPERVQTSFR